jgi:serine/threonine protein kinase
MLKGESPRRATYRILERLSSGIGDDVFLAHHEIFDGTIVQKTVSTHGYEDGLAASEPAFLNRLNHPRVSPVREAQFDPQEDRAITFVMPHFAGGSVHDALLSDYRFSISDSVQIAIDALDALAYLHREHGAVHRDTKPGNVLLDPSRKRGYLSDFGSAALIDAQGGALAVLGTNVYRPPEARPSGRVGISADLYGIGMMLWEMVNGRLPWETLELPAVEQRLQRGLRSVTDAQLAFEPHVIERLRRAIRKAFSRDPSTRFTSAEEFITALRRVHSIDWRHEAGRGLDGIWIGTWPPQTREARRTAYRVTARLLKTGPHAGHLLYEADFRRPGAQWRQTAADARIASGDAAAAAHFFETVSASAAHREPAR